MVYVKGDKVLLFNVFLIVVVVIGKERGRNIWSNPIPTLSFVSENSICEGLSVIVQAQDGFASYKWYVNRIEQRIAEAEKLGFEKIIVSKYNSKSLPRHKTNIEIVALAKVEELYQYLF